MKNKIILLLVPITILASTAAYFLIGRNNAKEGDFSPSSVSLDFDLAKISFLEDDNGNKYEPLEWQGPSPGGHHLEGVLIFSVINKEANKIKLNIQDSVLRTFEWDLK